MVLIELADRLGERAGLAGVEIATAGIGPKSSDESIQFGGGEIEQAWGSLGNKRREETGVIHALIWVSKLGGREDVIRAARGRAFDLLSEIEDELRDRPDGRDASGLPIVKYGHIPTISLDQGIKGDSRWCALEFDLVYKATLPT